jgi:hypothetical protein
MQLQITLLLRVTNHDSIIRFLVQQVDLLSMIQLQLKNILNGLNYLDEYLSYRAKNKIVHERLYPSRSDLYI